MEGSKVLTRMETNSEDNCFITMKDHKENFENNPKVRFINPAKNEIGRISKHILEKINRNLRTTLDLNQWKSTQNVIDWFDNIDEKAISKLLLLISKSFTPQSRRIYYTNRSNLQLKSSTYQM